MSKQVTSLRTFRALSVLIIALLAYSCSTSSDEPNPDPEPEPPPREEEPVDRVGDRELTIIVIDRDDESELTGYSIEIEGPVSASEEGVASEEFVLTDIVSGEYTITVTLDGYVAATVTESYELPEEESDDFIAETVISLRQMSAPVQVSNNESTTVRTGKPDVDDEAEEDEEVTLQISADTFPADVVEEDGSVNISVTRARPAQVTRDDTGQVNESLILTPATVLNNPVEITIPMRNIEGLENVKYVLQPGNIPLTPDGNGNLVATITPDPVKQTTTILGANFNEFREYKRVSTNTNVEALAGE